ncbi:MAG: hypothetical protein KIT07_06135, partial [Anaerolineales bacterium]|nr:hypothetical protein [Anaerolineales bacterium]
MKVRTGVLVLLLLTLSLAACGAQPQLAQASQATREPFLMAGGVFLSGPQDFLLPSELTGEAY